MNTEQTALHLDRFASKGEAKAARRLISALLKEGLLVSVSDGESFTVKKSSDKAAILAALCTTGEDTLIVRKADGEKLGFIWLIYGNASDGSELCADYSADGPIPALIERLFPI